MPEGPEVATIVKAINQVIKPNLKVKRLDIVEKPHFQHKFVRNGIPKIELLNNVKLISVYCKGKLIVFEFSNNVYALNTLGMSGTWMVNQADHYHARLNLVCEGLNLTFVDQRSFGSFKIVDRKGLKKKLKTIGHDLTKSPMPYIQWQSLRNNPKIKNKPLGELLMSQKWFSGIGNIYKAEILYRAKIGPGVTPENLKDFEWAEINVFAHKILKNALAAGGSSVYTYNSNGKLGKFQRSLKVYKKKECPKGHPISSILQNKRTTWYCASCQNQNLGIFRTASPDYYFPLNHKLKLANDKEGSYISEIILQNDHGVLHINRRFRSTI